MNRPSPGRARSLPPPPPPPREKKDRPLPDLPRPPLPEDNPRDEYARLLRRGAEVFRGQEYGRAEMFFDRATRVLPEAGKAHFLRAQALVALGKPLEAAEAVRAGLARHLDWPTARFRPLELYGKEVADYARHLADLEATYRRHPEVPGLAFLSGYVLWFDGRTGEAAERFRLARRVEADRALIDRFLRALPGGPAL